MSRWPSKFVVSQNFFDDSQPTSGVSTAISQDLFEEDSQEFIPATPRVTLLIGEGEAEIADVPEEDAQSKGASQAASSQEEEAFGRSTCQPLHTKFNLTGEQEMQVVDWYRDNPLFYDKSHRDYKNRDKKETLLRDIASSLSISSK